MPFVSPGYLATQSILQTLADQRAQAQQDFLNRLRVTQELREAQQDEYEHQDRQEAAQARVQATKDALEQRERAREEQVVRDYTNRFQGGDYAPADLDPQDRDILLKRGVLTQDTTPPVGPVPPDTPAPTALRFATSVQQRNFENYVNSLPEDSPERRAAEYERGTGHPMPAGALTPKPEKVPVFYFDGRSGQLLDSNHQPFQGELPANAKVLNRQYPPASTGAAPSSNEPTAADLQLAADIMKNPSVYKGLTPSKRTTGLVHALTTLGFDFNASNGLTPSMRASQDRLDADLKILHEIDPELPQESGLEGRLHGVGSLLYNKLTQENPHVVDYDAISQSMLSALARSSGEVGNLAEKEQTRYSALAPKVTDAAPVRKAKYAAIQFLRDAAAKGKTAAEMSPFLDYTKFFAAGGQGTPPPSEVSHDAGTIQVGAFTVRVKGTEK